MSKQNDDDDANEYLYLLQNSSLSDEKLESIVPGQKDLGDDFLDTFLLELESFSTYDRRIDQVQAKSISTILVQHNAWFRIVLETLTHLLAITIETTKSAIVCHQKRFQLTQQEPNH